MLHSADLDAEGMNVGVAQDKLNQITQAIADLFNTLNTREGAYHINPDDTGVLSDANKVNIFNVDENGKIL